MKKKILLSIIAVFIVLIYLTLFIVARLENITTSGAACNTFFNVTGACPAPFCYHPVMCGSGGFGCTFGGVDESRCE